VGNCGLVIKHIVASLLAIKSAKVQTGAEASSDSRDLEHIQRCFYLQCLSELLDPILNAEERSLALLVDAPQEKLRRKCREEIIF
jgi:hypothetical protein